MDLPSAPRRLTRYRQHAEALRHGVWVGRRGAVEGALRFGPTPAVPPVDRRDATAALAFLRGPDRPGAEGPTPGDLAARVGSCLWYHTIDLPGGVTTPGIYDHRELVGRYGLPADLGGRRVLDVATFDGFWAFELERRGGRVTALDLPASLELDLPPAVRARAEAERLGVPIGTSFAVARDALGSGVERREGSVYDLDPAAWGTYDLVHLGDLLLHLERPWEALRAIRSVVGRGGTLHLADAYDPLLVGPTVRYLGGWQDVEWWIPSLAALCQWLVDAGFGDLEILGSYQLNVGGSDGGHWRAIIRCRAA